MTEPEQDIIQLTRRTKFSARLTVVIKVSALATANTAVKEFNNSVDNTFTAALRPKGSTGAVTHYWASGVWEADVPGRFAKKMNRAIVYKDETPTKTQVAYLFDANETTGWEYQEILDYLNLEPVAL